MSDIELRGAPEPEWKRLVKKIKPEYFILFIVTFIVLSIIFYQSRVVPNLHIINSTDPFAEPETYKGEIPEGYSTILRYTESSVVPADITSKWLIVGYGVFILLYIVYAVTRTDERAIIDDEQAREKIMARWDYWKTTKKVKGELFLYGEIPKHHLRYRESESDNKPFEYVLAGIYKHDDGELEYVLIAMSPYPPYQLNMITPTTREFSRMDVCPNCGDWHDIKKYTSEEWVRYQELMRKKPTL